MNPPTVRTLDNLVSETNSIYDPQRQNYQNQIATSNTRLGDSERYLGQQQQNAFGDISQAAASRGALFSGFTPDQQAKYTSEKYLPALANLRAANEQTIQGLNTSILGLDSEQRQQALKTREGDLAQLYDFNKTQDERKFQTEQAQLAYEREMNKLREQQRFEASQNAANRASSAAAKPSPQSFLVSAFSGYKPAYEGGQAYYTEREVIPALVANYGMTEAQAKSVAYDYRKRVFGEGAGR